MESKAIQNRLAQEPHVDGCYRFFFGSSINLQRILMQIFQRLMANLKVSGHSSVVWYWSGDPMVPRSNPLSVRKFLLLSLLIWKGGFEILPNNTWDLLKKAYGTSKKLRFQFRGQLNKPFSEPTYLYTNLTKIRQWLKFALKVKETWIEVCK